MPTDSSSVQAGASRPVRAARFLLAGHLVPVTLVALYLAPALLGLYAFRDLQARVVAGALAVSILCYYVGFYGAALTQRTWRERRAPDRRRFRFHPRTLQNAALATLSVYGLLVLYLVVTSTDVALLAALRSADVTEITAAREAFVQTRTGGESIMRYLNAILFRVPVPFALVILYAYRNRWRHVALAAMLLCALLSLEKSLTAFILVPLGVYFLLSGRTRAVGAFVLAGVLVLAATILGTGALGEFRAPAAQKQMTLLTDSLGDRKNLFWILDSLALDWTGNTLQQNLRNSTPFVVSREDRLVLGTEGRPPAQDVLSNEDRPAPKSDGRPPIANALPPVSHNEQASAAPPSVPGGNSVADPASASAAAETPPPSSGATPDDRPAKASSAAPRVDAGKWREYPYRNLLANGDMRISDRRPGDAVTPSASTYVAARWRAVLLVGKRLTFEQSTDAPGAFTHSLKVTVASTHEPKDEEVFELQQQVEGFKISDLAFGSSNPATVTLSFWVKSSLPGRYNATIVNGRATRSYLAQYDVVTPNRWERKVLVVRGDSRGGAGQWPDRAAEALAVSFNLGSGSAYHSDRSNEWRSGFFRESDTGVVAFVQEAGATLYLTGVQLEAGPAATEFERRDLETELALAHWRPHIIGESLLERLPQRLEPYARPVIEDPRMQTVVRRTQFILNRIAWVPYVTAYDWFHFHHDVLEDRFLLGRTIGVVARAQGAERYPIEHQVFKYQYGVSATATATANAVYFADAYLNFGWFGVVLYSVLIGAIFYVVAASRSLPLLAVSVMSTFSLMIASFPANMLSGGLALLLLLAWIFREPPMQEGPA